MWSNLFYMLRNSPYNWCHLGKIVLKKNFVLPILAFLLWIDLLPIEGPAECRKFSPEKGQDRQRVHYAVWNMLVCILSISAAELKFCCDFI